LKLLYLDQGLSSSDLGPWTTGQVVSTTSGDSSSNTTGEEEDNAISSKRDNFLLQVVGSIVGGMIAVGLAVCVLLAGVVIVVTLKKRGEEMFCHKNKNWLLN